MHGYPFLLPDGIGGAENDLINSEVKMMFPDVSPSIDINARSFMYRLFSNLFAHELNPQQIESIQSGSAAKLFGVLEEIEAYAPIIGRLRAYFSGITDLKQATLDLAESYAWLFHGVGGPHGAPLTASVYLSPNGNIRQETEAYFYQHLQKYGLSFKNMANEPSDHLSVILEFVSWLDEMAQTTDHPEPWLKEQKAVIDEYLLTWLPEFALLCRKGDRLGFYAGLAQDALDFVAEDARYL